VSKNLGVVLRSVRFLRLTLLVFLGVEALSACTVGPNFQRPQVQVPDRWVGPAPAPSQPPASPAEKDLARWWTVFSDPMLSSLVERAVNSNLDLKLAEARIRQARAARGVAASDMGPTIDASGSFQRSQTPGSSASTTKARDTTGPTANQYRSGFDATWELDIFGGVRREIEAAEADLEAAVEDRRDVLVTLTAEVAQNYMDLRAFQQRISIARQNLDAQRRAAGLTRQRFEAGFVSGLDVANAEAQAATTAAQTPLLEASVHQTIYRIGVLLGREPAALMQELSAISEIPAAPPSVPVGVPSELLRRRPDIRRAEAQIHAATARIGVATADLFPRITLLGSGGFQAGTTGSWFDAVSRFWSFGPSIRWPVFDTGRVRANIEQKRAFEEQSAIAYRQAVLTALQEVENALIASSKEQEHRRSLIEAVSANRRAARIAVTIYTEGQSDFLNVLEAQRSLYATEDALAQSTRTISTNLIALYKALGGGWDPESQDDRIH
jgi:multidrug efflux system outer membrane protein